MLYFLPDFLQEFVNENINSLRELRIRKDMPVMADLNGVFVWVKINGEPVRISQKTITEIVTLACNNSFYKFNECLKQGFIPCGQGIRMGVCGECVMENNEVKTIKNFFSICIRFPHQIIGCAKEVFNLIREDLSVKSLLIISKPGVGKTTLLRDLTRIISNVKMLNILVVDEKNEIFYEGCDLGLTTDVISGCDKKFGFYNAVKNLSPSVVIVDELTCANDAFGAMFASKSGVKIICSIHGENLEDVKNKDYALPLLKAGCFEKIVLLLKESKGFKMQEVFY